MGARGERVMRSEGSKGERMGKAYCILGFRVPTTSVGARGKRGVKGSKVYCILGFRVPTTSVGGRGKGSEGGQREQRVCGVFNEISRDLSMKRDVQESSLKTPQTLRSPSLLRSLRATW